MKDAHNNGALEPQKTDYLYKKVKNAKKFQKSIAIVKKM